MSAPRRNIELKATDPDPAWSRERCLALGAEDRGVIEQRDTYFLVRSGGLKLREETPGSAHLIQYERADEPRQRLSSYRTVPVVDGAGLRLAFEAALGIRAVVVKRRRLLLWETVRIHLDDVEGLGWFIELEAVAAPDSDLTHEHALVAELREQLEIADERVCATGYADMLG